MDASLGHATLCSPSRAERNRLDCNGSDWGSGAGRRAYFNFLKNAVQQIPNFGAVVRFTLSKRLWLVIVFVVLEALALLARLGMKKLEANWNKPPKRRY